MKLIDFLIQAAQHMPAMKKHIDKYIVDETTKELRLRDIISQTAYEFGNNPLGDDDGIRVEEHITDMIREFNNFSIDSSEMFTAIVLPTEKSNFPHDTILQHSYHTNSRGKLIISNAAIRCPHRYVNIYLVTDNVIEEQEFYYHMATAQLYNARTRYEDGQDGRKKVAFSSCHLQYEIPCPDNIQGCEVYHTKSIPRLSLGFIDRIISDYNSGKDCSYSAEIVASLNVDKEREPSYKIGR